jgi:hypothetical protein
VVPATISCSDPCLPTTWALRRFVADNQRSRESVFCGLLALSLQRDIAMPEYFVRDLRGDSLPDVCLGETAGSALQSFNDFRMTQAWISLTTIPNGKPCSDFTMHEQTRSGDGNTMPAYNGREVPLCKEPKCQADNGRPHPAGKQHC